MRKVNVDIPFVGLANDPQDGKVPADKLIWTSDLEGQIGVGEIDDEALALARHPKMLAVCGARKVATEDLDAFAMLVRPGEEIKERAAELLDRFYAAHGARPVRELLTALGVKLEPDLDVGEKAYDLVRQRTIDG